MDRPSPTRPSRLLVPLFNGVNFEADPQNIQKIHELKERWHAIRKQVSLEHSYDQLESDPILSPATPQDKEALLKRFLLAEDFHVAKAAERLRSTLVFRKRFNILQFYRLNAGTLLLKDSHNPGAEAYFVDSGCVDKEGAPVLVGKMQLCSNDNMHSWAHLRAALFICERIAVKCVHPIQSASYILDTSPVEKNFVGSFGPMGGDTKSPTYNKFNRQREEIGLDGQKGVSKDVARFVTSDDP